MTDRPSLRALADRLGILPEYTDVAGRPRPTSDATREALIDALGFDGSDETRARRELETISARERRRLVDPVTVQPIRTDQPASLPIRTADDAPITSWHVTVETEDGTVRTAEGAGSREPRYEIPLPSLDLGYHTVAVSVETEAGPRHTLHHRIVHPPSCHAVQDTVAGGRGFGMWANLYALRGHTNWGVGDVGDLTGLIDWAGDVGASFVGINPLHALRNQPPDVSPYFPRSRLYRNPIYIDMAAVPELAECAEAQGALTDPEVRDRLDTLRASDRVDYAAVWDLKDRILRIVHRHFERHHANTTRGADYTRYCVEGGNGLRVFADAMANDATGTSPAYHMYLQFELDRQLAAVADRARARGLDVGVYHDLAIGTAPDGIDTLIHPGLMVQGARLGAPPDAYAPAGQDWGLPPLHPLRLAEQRYAYWIDLLRAGFAHGGALRIDHVMGLERQFWIPAGRPASEGAYVRFPSDDLFGILALESHRHRALVVGESLGTLPHGFLDRLEGWGVLSSHVVYFERDGDGGFHPSEGYPYPAMVTVNTHDLPPLAGYWAGHDLDRRRDLHLVSEDDHAASHGEREQARRMLRDRLRAEGLVDLEQFGEAGDLSPAVHQFLGRASAALVGVAYDDLAGEIEGVNIPGASPEIAKPWTRRNRASIDDVRADPRANSVLDRLREARGRVRGS